ncbi:MAG TPA: nucleotide sugar dehydrogenase [Gaiellaceae bacterium]
MSRIGIFGAGWVGVVTGACFAELGHEVVIRDVLPERVDALREGGLPFHEPELTDLVERNAERLAFTLDPSEAAAGADFLYVCVGTPPTYAGDADLSYVWSVLDDLPGLEGNPVLVMKSTVPVGTGEKVRAALDARGLEHVGYVSNPEFLSEGTAVRDFMSPDRIVVGAFDQSDGDRVEELHASLEAPVVRSDVASAEMIKLAANAFLMTRISFINEIANVCELVGADVQEVARGIGLDHRLGPHFLRAGIGYGGSCLDGRETVMTRRGGRIRLQSLEALFEELALDSPEGAEVVWPEDLEVLAWDPMSDELRFSVVSSATRRAWGKPMLEVHTKLGRRVRCTPDHPFVVSNGEDSSFNTKPASELTARDWLPLAQSAPANAFVASDELDVLEGLDAVGLAEADIIVRPDPRVLASTSPGSIRRALDVLDHPRAAGRSYEIRYANALRLLEAREIGVDLAGATFGTARNGTYVPGSFELDDRFWRIVGLYLAEGHCSVDGGRHRLQWSFHPTGEPDLVREVAGYWRAAGLPASVRTGDTTTSVSVSSRILAGWWLGTLGAGSDCYTKRLPDLIWSASDDHKRALLAGMWRGDGSWSFINGGPSVVLEYGTVSRQLADGLLRLLGDLGVAARLKVGRTAKSTVDTYWLVISGANQIEDLLPLVPRAGRKPIRDSLGRQSKRIAPTGYRLTTDAVSSVRVREVRVVEPADSVYSLEVPGPHTFVTTGGLILHNCFPKDASALKQLASNSGYHFQLLSAVIEVNELQKRRVVAKLQKHLGKLRGKRVALLGLAFKPNTDDMREAPSIVLASRLLAEGAEVRGWDPVASPGHLMNGVTLCETVAEAVKDADAAVIVTEWDELRGLATPEVGDSMRNPLIVDGRNILDPEAVRRAGFAYEGIGRPTSALSGLPETTEPEHELA